MTTIATMTAATITGRWSAMPTAVITLSSEKITSSSMIWTITAAKPLPPLSGASSSSPSTSLKISVVAFQIRNRPPANRTRSRQRRRTRRRS